MDDCNLDSFSYCSPLKGRNLQKRRKNNNVTFVHKRECMKVEKRTQKHKLKFRTSSPVY